MNELLFVVNWPATLDNWFRALLRQEPISPPQVTYEEWGVWLTAVAHHGMSALVYTWLLNAPANHQPPPPIMTQLRVEHVANIALAERRRRQAANLVTRLDQVDIQPIVLKGTALAHWLYDLPELRPSADIDFLIRPDDFDAVFDILTTDEFTPKVERMPGLPGAWECEFLASSQVNGIPRYDVDLHWTLSPFEQVQKQCDHDTLFLDAADIQIGNSAISILDPVTAFIHASFHLIYNHPMAMRLIWLYDIHLLAQYISKMKMWVHVVEGSVLWQARLALAYALQLTQEWFGTIFPETISDTHWLPPLQAEIEMHQVTQHRLTSRPKSVWFNWHRHQMQSMNTHEKWIYIQNRLFPGELEMDNWYPEFRSWPLPLAHLGRLFLLVVGKVR